MHWCTEEFGLVKTAARSALRPNSPFAGKLDLFYEAEIAFVRSRRGDLHNLREADVLDYREGISSTYPRTVAATYFIRLIELVAEKETPIPALHDLLRRALGYLAGSEPTKKAVLHFENQLANELGLGPESPTQAVMAIHSAYHSVPTQRGEVMDLVESIT